MRQEVADKSICYLLLSVNNKNCFNVPAMDIYVHWYCHETEFKVIHCQASQLQLPLCSCFYVSVLTVLLHSVFSVFSYVYIFREERYLLSLKAVYSSFVVKSGCSSVVEASLTPHVVRDVIRAGH